MINPQDPWPGMEGFDSCWRIPGPFRDTNWWMCTQKGHPFRTRVRRWSRDAEQEWWDRNYPGRSQRIEGQ